MNFNILILFSFYFLIIFSVMGYGAIISNYVLKYGKNFNYGFYGLFGVLFLIVYSYISNFFYSHNIYHNSVLLLFGIIGFLFHLSKNQKLYKNEYKYILILFLLIFPSILIYKAHDDFSYYHFPYVYNLINNDIIYGIGNINHGFRTPSSIFYFNSLLYLPIIQYNLFHVTPILIFGFVNFVLLKKIFDRKKIDFISILSLFSLIFISIFFYRISEHGTDRSALILVLLLVIEVLILLNFILL